MAPSPINPGHGERRPFVRVLSRGLEGRVVAAEWGRLPISPNYGAARWPEGGLALTWPLLGQGVPEEDRGPGNTHHSKFREMFGERERGVPVRLRGGESLRAEAGAGSPTGFRHQMLGFFSSPMKSRPQGKRGSREKLYCVHPRARFRDSGGGSRGSRAQGKAARVFIGYCWGWGKSVLESHGRVLLGTAGG